MHILSAKLSAPFAYSRDWYDTRVRLPFNRKWHFTTWSPSEKRQVIAGTSAFTAAAMTVLMLYLTGMLMHELRHWPAPVVMLFLAPGMKLAI